MGNNYLLRDGLISDSSTYGASVLALEKTNSVDAYTLTTSDSWSTALAGAEGKNIDSIAVNLSSRAATPTGVLSGSIKQYPGILTKANILQDADSPFGTGIDGSVSFNGTSSFISVPTGTNINLGAGNFTIELWIKTSNFSISGVPRRIFCFGVSNDAAANNLQLYLNPANAGKITVRNAADRITSANSVADNNWHHICVLRDSNVIRLYIDGVVQSVSYTSAVNFDEGTTVPMYIGQYNATQGFYSGLISNFRIVVGTAITPPLPAAWSPLLAVTNTTFLYKSPYQDVYENDPSYTTTSVGTWPISSFTSYDGSNNSVSPYPLNWQLLKLSSPFTNSTGFFKINFKTSNPDQLALIGTSTDNGVDYNRMTVLSGESIYEDVIKTNVQLLNDSPPLGGETVSVFFDGTSKIYTGLNSQDFSFTTEPFTIEGWFKLDITNSVGNLGLISCMNGGNSRVIAGWGLSVIKATKILQFVSDNSGTAIVNVVGTGFPLTDNTWYHIAVAQEGALPTTNRIRLFLNGQVVATSTTAETLHPSPLVLSLGEWNASEDRRRMKGYISNVRIIKGKCLYKTAFTPTFPLTLHPPGNNINTSFLYKAPYDEYIYNVSGDNLHIGGAINGHTTQSITITADNTAVGSVYVHKNGLLKFPDTSTTLSAVGLNGLQATSEGTIQVGSSTSPVLRNTTHQIILPGNHIGICNGGKLDVYGAYKVPYGKLDVDLAAGDTRLWGINSSEVTNFSTWNTGDTAVILPNTTASNTTEVVTITQGNISLFADFTPAAAFSHPIIDYLPAVANLTRNVKIGGLSTTLKGNIQATGGAVVNLNNVEFKYIDNSLFTGIDGNGIFAVSGCTLSGNGTETLIKSKGNIYSSEFDGTTSWITGGAVSNTDFNVDRGTDFTLELFLKVIENGETYQVLFRVGELYSGGTSDNGFQLDLVTNNRIGYYQCVDSAQYSITSPINSIKKNKWYHVAVVGVNSEVKLYIDGVFQAKGPQYSYNFNSLTRYTFSYYYYGAGIQQLFKGMMSNMRFVKGRAIYTSNFTPPTSLLTEITDEGVSTALLTLQDTIPIDNSERHEILGLKNIIPILDSPFGSPTDNLNVNNNVLFKTEYGIYLNNTSSDNTTISNNLILSSKSAGIYIQDGLRGTPILNKNMAIGPSPYGTYIENNTTGTKLSNIINFNNTYGMVVSSSHTGQIDGIINIYNAKDGILVDGTISQLNETTFSNITASNNKTLGFRVTGNPIDHLSPITLNINNLVANDNLSGGFEGYCITGNLSSLELNRNGFYGMKTSIGNYNTTINGITALMSNTAGISASVGILSGVCYYPILIDRANLGKSNPASIFGAGIILDSTKFSQFIVNNSTIKGGTFDFQLKTSKDIIEGSYLISKTIVSNTPVGLGITPANYQSDTYKATGFAFTNMNNTSGYHITYLAGGQRFSDTGIYATIADAPSERLTPSSNLIKLKSGSKFVALNANERTTIRVSVRKSNASNGSVYNGTAPRLMLRAAPHMGIPADIVMAQLNTAPANFKLLTASTPTVTDSGVLEFYVDCDGTVGWINIDNWSAN